MKERISRQISVQLEPRLSGPDKFQKVVVQILAGGMETQLLTVPNYDSNNQRQGASKVEQITKRSEDFDVCIGCQVESTKEAIERLEEELRVSSQYTVEVGPK